MNALKRTYRGESWKRKGTSAVSSWTCCVPLMTAGRKVREEEKNWKGSLDLHYGKKRRMETGCN